MDIYMPDFKLWDAEHCRKYLVASDYADAARAVIAAMHSQVGELKVDEQGLALRGVLVRHLVMPGLLDDTHKIMRWIATCHATPISMSWTSTIQPTKPKPNRVSRKLTGVCTTASLNKPSTTHAP